MRRPTTPPHRPAQPQPLSRSACLSALALPLLTAGAPCSKATGPAFHDSGLPAAAGSAVFWLDRDRIAFVAPDRAAGAPPGTAIILWAPATGAVTRHASGADLCVGPASVRFYAGTRAFRDAAGRRFTMIHERVGPLGRERDVFRPRGSRVPPSVRHRFPARPFNRFDCRYQSAGEPEPGRKRHLLHARHGTLSWVPAPLQGADHAAVNRPVLTRADGSRRALDLPRAAIPTLRYAAWRGAYFGFHPRLARFPRHASRRNCISAVWLRPDGDIHTLCLPRPTGITAALDAAILPSRAGYVLRYTAHAARRGGLLLLGDPGRDARTLVEGPVTAAAIAADGCRLGFAHRPTGAAAGLTLKLLDVCTLRRPATRAAAADDRHAR